MPQVVVNKTKCKEGIEGLELFRKLAKQVLSQLSYTPTVGLLLILRHLQPLANCEKPRFAHLEWASGVRQFRLHTWDHQFESGRDPSFFVSTASAMGGMW